MKDFTKHIEILQEARKLIESGQSVFVCNAIRAAVNTKNQDMPFDIREDFARGRVLIDWIHKQIRGHATYDMWLFCTHDISESGFGPRYREARLAWIDAMIEELRK